MRDFTEINFRRFHPFSTIRSIRLTLILHFVQYSDMQELQQPANGTYPSVDALADELGISRKSTYDGLRRGDIPSIRLGKRFILPRAAIQEWLRTAGRGPK